MFLGLGFLFTSHDPLIGATVFIFLTLVAAGAAKLYDGEYEAVGRRILHSEVAIVAALAMIGFWSFPYALHLGHISAAIFALELGITIYAWLLNRVIKMRNC
jgi:hypothetical protein